MRQHFTISSIFPAVRSNPSAKSVLALLFALLVSGVSFAQPPAIGTKAPDFTLSTPSGRAVTMSSDREGKSLVLVVLRGYPGYDCPFCVQQVHDFIVHGADFAAKGTRVLLVYPGPPAALDQHAKAFLEKQANLPDNVVLVVDPDYKMTNLYGLRWDAPHETAYPSTFILDRNGIVVFEKVSHGHGDRLSAREALEHLPSR